MKQTPSDGLLSIHHVQLSRYINDAAIPNAKKFLDHHGEHMAILVFCNDSGHLTMMSLEGGIPSADKWPTCRMVLKEAKAVWYFVVSEAWLAIYDRHSSCDVKPSQREDKAECLVIVGNTVVGEPVVRVFTLRREEGKVSLGDEQDCGSEFGGEMIKLLED